MLHLLRLNLIIYFACFVAGVCVLLITGGEVWPSVRLAAGVAGILQMVTLAVLFFAWKWIPGFSFLVFPNLAGRWTGTVRFTREGQEAALPASLDIEQNVNALSLVLETERGESETLVVYPRRLSNRRLELLYVYETRSKEGSPPPSYRYRGTAVMRVERKPMRLLGTYYTEQGGCGVVTFQKTSRRRNAT